MEHDALNQRHAQIVHYLSHLPQKMVSLHGDDHVAAHLLYDLCHEHCFNFARAAYFVDNPDFNWLKGVVGCRRTEIPNHKDVWGAGAQFSQQFVETPFHQLVKEISRPSLKRAEGSPEEAIKELAQSLNLQDYGYCRWNMKHDNQGLLLFEHADKADAVADEHITNGATLLSFCPIF